MLNSGYFRKCSSIHLRSSARSAARLSRRDGILGHGRSAPSTLVFAPISFSCPCGREADHAATVSTVYNSDRRSFFGRGAVWHPQVLCLPCCLCLLLPPLFVHAEHKQPKDQRCCPEESEGYNERKQTVSERRIEETQPTQTSQYRQHSQNPRQEGGSDNEVARQECIESEKYQGDCRAPVIHLEKEERQRLQLFRAEYTQVVRTSQDEQGGDEKEAAQGLDDATGEAQERRHQRDAPAHRFKQIIKESCDDDVAR